MKKKETFLTAIKGFVIGASMVIPGVSGGTMALILGIYKKLIHSINTFLKDFKNSVPFLLIFCIGAGLGILMLSNVMSYLLEKFELPIMYLFIGAIVGGLPLLIKQTKVKKLDAKNISIGVISIIIGMALVLSLGFIPKADFVVSNQFSLGTIAMQLVTGIVIAIALVLPGISTSHMLLILGMYDTTLNAVKTLNLAFIIPLVISIVIGIFLTTGILELAMNKAPKVTYFTIIGFVLGSIIDVFPGFPSGWEILICLILFILGYLAIRFISKFSDDHPNEKPKTISVK